MKEKNAIPDIGLSNTSLALSGMQTSKYAHDILLLNGPSRTKPWRPMVGNKQPHQHSHCNHNCNNSKWSSRYQSLLPFSRYRQDTKLPKPRTDRLDALGIRYPRNGNIIRECCTWRQRISCIRISIWSRRPTKEGLGVTYGKPT
jgi:hypothetical protein